MQEKIDVLIVDDSALMRNVIGRIVEESPGFRLIGKAMNGLFALKKLETLDPDVIVLDLEMPEMNGIQFLGKRKELGLEIPVIILSSIALQGAQITMEALSLGASDFILKPSGGPGEDIQAVAQNLRNMIQAYGSRYKSQKELRPAGTVKKDFHTEIPLHDLPAKAPATHGLKLRPTKSFTDIQAIAIGISTGGPNALRQIFSELDKDFSLPILVVQHMPAGFTSEFARSLGRICPIEVKEAEDGDLVRPGRILIAPGDYHIHAERKSLSTVVRVTQSELCNGHRPSAGILFHSAAQVWGSRIFGLIMTGMGRDGSAEIGEIKRKGGLTAGQDEASSVVYGMPRVANELENLELVYPLNGISGLLNEISRNLGMSPAP